MRRTILKFCAVFCLVALISFEGKNLSGHSEELEFDLIVDRTTSIQSIEQNDLPIGASVAIHSGGGDPALFRALSDLFVRKRATLHFIGKCYSACAEYLYTSDVEKEFYPTSLIGFHWNSAINESVVASIANSTCLEKYQNETKRREDHLKKNGVNPEYWRTTKNILSVVSVEAVDETECSYAITFKNQLWIPNTQQLEAIAGTEINSKICNEDLACIEKFYRRRQGQRIVIDETPYIATKEKLEPVPSH